MLSFFMGPKIFKMSLNNYLQDFQFSNSNLDQVWNIFTTTIKKVKPDILPDNLTVKKIMEPWFTQDGYPLITVTRDYDTNFVTVTQEYFSTFNDNKDPYNGLKMNCWTIPLSFMHEKKLKNEDYSVNHWLRCYSLFSIPIDANKDDWLILNFKQNVLGRVNYDERNWLLIQKAFLGEDVNLVFDVFTRASLISDMFVLAGAGKLQFEIVLNTLIYLPQEKHFSIWNLVLNEFSQIRRRLFGTILLKPFEKYVREILQQIFQNEEYSNMDEFSTQNYSNYLLKKLIIKTSCEFDVEACRVRSRDIVEKWENSFNDDDMNRIPNEVQEAVRCQAVKYGGKKYWKSMWHKFLEEKSTSRIDILAALACSSHTSILKKYLKFSIDERYFRRVSSSVILENVVFNEKGYKILKKFFTGSWKNIYARIRTKVIQYSFLWLLERTTRRKDYIELIKFANSKEELKKIQQELIEKAEIRVIQNISWLENSEESLKRFFKIGFFDEIIKIVRR